MINNILRPSKGNLKLLKGPGWMINQLNALEKYHRELPIICNNTILY
jgi:hypothetical protein